MSVHWDTDRPIVRAERWISRRGRWWEAAIVIGLCAAISCSPDPAHANPTPTAVCTDRDGHQFIAQWGQTGPGASADVWCVPSDVPNPGPNPGSDVPDPDGEGYLPHPAADTLAAEGPEAFEVGGSQALDEHAAVAAFLEAHYQATIFLRWHQVQRWAPLAECESGGNWSAVSRSGRYRGGLQMTPAFWRTYGGPEFAPAPELAEPWQQAEIADRHIADEGDYGAWPACARRLGLPR